MEGPNNMQRLSDVTFGDVAKGIARYKSVIMLFVAIMLVAVVLPGHNTGGSSNASSSGRQTVRAGAADQGATAAAGTDATAGTDTSGAGVTATGSTSGTTGTKTAASTSVQSPASAAGGAGGADPNCDPATKRIRLPSVYAAPCVPPYDGNNGGATYQGVTATQITICGYEPQSTPQGQAIAAALGDTDTQQQIDDTRNGFIKLFQEHYQTYGRTINYVALPATGTDDGSYKADAITCAKKIHGFMSWSGGGDAYVDELVADHVLCYCTVSLPKDYYLARAPYVWGTGLPDENQAYIMRAEMIGKQIAGRKAKYAGDPTMQLKDRTFGLIWYNTTANSYEAGEKFFVAELAKYNVKLVDAAQYTFDLNTAQQDSQTIMAKFASENITDVIFVGDPVYPEFFTSAATKQNFFPEWIVTGSALTDTAFFARIYDKDQWKNAFGLSLLAARGPTTDSEADRLWDWEYHSQPPAAAASQVMVTAFFITFTGIELAGPKLTPETFRDGLFSYPVSPAKPGITVSTLSWSHQLWGYDDYNASDDSTELFWDSTANGPDETNHNGVGMYRYIHMGKRYLPGQMANEDFKAFADSNDNVTIYDKRPDADNAPTYPNVKYYCPPNPHC
jgi:hypothetical protein